MMDESSLDPYAPPKADLLELTQVEKEVLKQGVWRDGNRAVALKWKRFPDRCVRCNQSAQGYKLKRRLAWHHPILYVLVIIPILYIVVGLFATRRARVDVGLCPRHRKRHRISIAAGWLGLLTSIAGIGFGFTIPSRVGGSLVLGGLLGFLATLVYVMIFTRVVLPTRIDKTRVWLKVGQPFLDSLTQVSL